MDPQTRISELEDELRAMREAARLAAETAAMAIERLQQADHVVQAAISWRHAHDDNDASAITRVIRTARDLRDRVDAYEKTRSAS